MSKLNRVVATSAIAFLLFSGIPLARAGGIPVIDAIANQFNSQNLVQTTLGTVQTTTDTLQTLYEWAETFTLAALKKKLVDGLSDKIIGYAQGGGKGAKFVVNWQDYLGKASVTGVKAANDSVASSNVCSSFRKPLLQALGATGGGTGAANPNLECDFAPGELEALDQNPANRTTETYRKTLEPQNNIYGAYWLGRAEQNKKANEAREAAENEAVAGGGFISPKSSDGTITTPGSVIKDLTSKAAGSDIDLIVNATQLKDLVGSIGSSLINEVTKPNDSGLSGVNLAARRKSRNNTRTAGGKVITTEDSLPNCEDVALSFIFDINDFDADKNGVISSTERKAAIDSEQGIYDSCMEGRNAQTGNDVFARQGSVAGILAKRREAKKILDDMYDRLVKTSKTLSRYLELPKSKTPSKFINPNYDPEATDIHRYEFAFATNVYTRRCFAPISTNGTGSIKFTSNDKKYTRPRAVSPCSATNPNPCPETTINSIVPLIDAAGNKIPSYNPNNPGPVNVFANKNLRCTYVDGSEIDYYEKELIPKISRVMAANDLAIKKLNALNSVIKLRGTTGPQKDRAEKVQAVMDDFARIGKPFPSIVPDPTPDNFCNNDKDDDASPTRDEPGCFDASLTWRELPDYATSLPNYLLTRLSLTAQSNTLAREGMITFGNGEYDDDPSNKFYDPAFDPDEAEAVYRVAKGDITLLGNLRDIEIPDEDTGATVQEDPGGDADP